MRRRLTAARGDEGSALVITLMVMVLVMALSTTVAMLTIGNLQSSWRAQQAGSALNAADAGVSQALNYLRRSGVRRLSCSPTCPTNAWGNQNAPTTIDLPGGRGQRYAVWIEPVRPFPGNNPGTYRIHSKGLAPGTATRSISVDVSVSSIDIPLGVFSRTISGGGSAAVTRESVFSTGCVYDRAKIHMVSSDIDAAYGIPVGVHSTQFITESNGSGQFCPNTDRKLIHRTSGGAGRPCNTTYPNDQDLLGGDLVGTPCASVQTTYPSYYGPRNLTGDAANDVVGSWIRDEATMSKLFNLRQPAFTESQLAQLKMAAQSQGNYWTSTQQWAAQGWAIPDEDDAVMYFDLSAADLGGTVDLNKITNFARAAALSATDPSCAARSLVIVIDGGNAKLNSSQSLAASLILTSTAPNGQVYKANGTADFIGTIYADNVNLVGDLNISLDQCFLANQSPALLDFSTSNYVEEDRGLG